MKAATVAGLLASALHAQQAVATYSWGSAQQFSSPENCNNTCDGQQSGGWSFGNVPTGSVSSFDGFGMQGFGCADSFGSTGGRRGLGKRFAGKALVGKATNDDSSCPKISSDRDFSISQFHMSSDKDNQQVELHYDMPDGSVCTQKTTCGTNPQQFNNNQCGGAKQVRVRGDCSVAFHSFGFDCNPAPPPPSTSPPVSTTSQPPVTTTTQPPQTTTTSCDQNHTPNTSGVCVPKTTSTTTTCGETETTNTQGVCVPKSTPSTTTPATTPPVTTPSTTPVTTPATTTTPCQDTETPNGQGQCVPKTTSTPPVTTPVTTPATCTAGATPNDKGECSPATSTPSTTTTPVCAGGDKPNGQGGCGPNTTSAPLTSTTPVTSTVTSCGEGSTMDISLSSCISKSVTGGTGSLTTPLGSTSACGEGSFLSNGFCQWTAISTTPSTPTAPITTTTPVTSCASGSTMEGSVCKPTGGVTTSTTSCGSGSSMEGGVCKPTGGSTVPGTSTPLASTSSVSVCNGDQEMQNGQCVPKKPTGGVTSSSTSSAVSPPKSPPPEAGCPLVLPRCIATWIQKAGCSSNSDTACICPNKDLITNVQGCVEAWGGSDADVQAAYSFLVGLCAEYVPQNPGICTGVPSTVTLVPQPPQVPVTGGSGAPAPTPPANLPSTVITFTRTMSTTTLTQTVTVPQVSFNTITQHAPATGGPAGPTQGGVGLVPAVPLTQGGSSPSGAPPAPVPGTGGASTTFVPSTATGLPATRTGSSPIGTFTGAANKPAYAVAAGLLAVVAFLA